MRRVGGFTLLEVLVAISIFAVIGLAANQMLRTVLNTHEITSEKVETMALMQRAFAALDRDISHLVPRLIRDEFGDPQSPLLVATGPYFLELTRSGWSNPIGLPRSNLQRVAYDFNGENQLVRRFWLVLDRAEDSEPIEQIVLEGVEDFRVTLLDADGNTTNVWPDSDFGSALPTAIEVNLQIDGAGEFRKVYDLVDLIAVSAAGAPGSSGSGSSGSNTGGTNSGANATSNGTGGNNSQSINESITAGDNRRDPRP